MEEEKLVFCGTEIWNLDLIWNSDTPRLTPCLRHVALVLVPCGCFSLITAFILGCRKISRPSEITPSHPWTLLHIFKLIFSSVLIASSLTELGSAVKDHLELTNGVPVVVILSQSVRLLSFILALMLQLLQRRRGQWSSSPLFVFWSVLSFCGFFSTPVTDLIFDDRKPTTTTFHFVMGSIMFPLILGQMVLSAFSDPKFVDLFPLKKDENVIKNQPLGSRLMFSWINRVVLYGYRNMITVDDLDLLSKERTSRHTWKKLEKHWTKQKEKVQKRQPHGREPKEEEEDFKSGESSSSPMPSLVIALIKSYWPWMAVAATLELLFDLINILPPLVLDLILSYISNEEPHWHGYVYASLLFVTSAVASFLMSHNMFFLVSTSLLVRSGLTAAIYRKALCLSSASRQQYTVGEMCNLLAVDVQKVSDLIWYFNLVWSAPIRIFLTIVLLWRYLGVSCLAGVAVMIILMPLTGFIARRSSAFQDSQMTKKDARLRQMNEILNGIKVLKLFAWEFPFMDQITEIRNKEVSMLRKFALLNAVVIFIWFCAPFLVAISSFVTYVLIDEHNILDPSKAFVSLTLFNTLRFSLSIFPEVIADIVQARISIRRLHSFILSEELKSDTVGHNTPSGIAVAIDRCSFSWSNGEQSFLCDVSFVVPKGSLVAVVGMVGAGKSALLSAILGEMHKNSGSVNVKGSIAYVAQQAWIQNATLRDNILFLKSMETMKYNNVMEKCCLKPDLEVLPGGDLTEIGEKGVNLSGGQKQRVSLARAVYQDADIYLLDDPLSAVDAHVGSHIFSNVIGPTGSLRRKTRIFVTHDLSVLPEVDVILVMANGRIEETGSYEELMGKKGEFSRFVEEHLKSMKEEESSGEEDILRDAEGREKSPDIVLSTEELKEQMKRLGSRLSRSSSVMEKTSSKQHQQPPPTTLVEAERMEVGRVKTSIFLAYFSKASYYLTALMMLGFAAYQGFEVGSSLWLSKWSEDPPLPDGTQDISLRNQRISIYGLLGIGQGLSILAAAFLMAIATTRASVGFHRQMLMSILRSPMVFFDTTPIGRILNRFGKDISTVDTDIPKSLDNFLSLLMSIFGTIIVICITNALIIVIVIPLLFINGLVQVFYMATSRQLRRLVSVTLSPVYSCFSETVQGVITIRAFDAQQHFTEREDKIVDSNVTVSLTSMILNRWIEVRLELLGCCVVFIVCMFSVVGRSQMEAGLVGLTLSYALKITEVIANLIKFYTALETRMVSVERIDEYSTLPSEAPWETEKKLPTTWPQHGEVIFQDYKLRYRENLDLVLRGVNVDISPKEKVGIVGRTGAGKSSLALALFRIIEPAGGVITIDGVDISQMGLHDLRSRLTVIPQDPVLFSGTLRLNLDPTNNHSDNELWSAIDHAHLRSFVVGLKEGLDFPVAESGNNLSVGQRQQLCLARALLKKTKILVLDEATAAVDMETDRLIQNTIRTEFVHSTVITIAHRLYTILDYDRIIVMDGGKIVEQGKPDLLLRKPDSAFYQLGKDAGLL